MRVKSIVGTTRTCSCVTRLDHWEKATGQKASSCATKDCGRHVIVGGDVVKVGTADEGQYIVPLCSACNLRADEFDVDVPLVPTTVQKTCK